MDQAEERDRTAGRLIAVVGGKGGVGCTLVAAGLVADWHQGGVRASIAPLTPGNELELLLPRGDRPTVFPRPSDPFETVAADGERLVLDCGALEGVAARRALLRADLVLVIGTPDAFGVRSLNGGWRQAADLGVEARRCGLVLNRSGVSGGIPIAEVESALGARLWATLPESPVEVASLSAEGLSGRRTGLWRTALHRLSARLDEALSELPLLPPPASLRPEATPTLSHLSCQLKQEALRKVVDRLEGCRPTDAAALRRRAAETAAAVVDELRDSHRLPRQDVDGMVAQLVDEVAGLGILEDLVRDPTVTEVMINGPSRVYVERYGRLAPVPCSFGSTDDITRLIERIVVPLGRRIDESSPMVDARLPDGSRLNAVIPPLALDGPLITIRRFGVAALTMEDLVNRGTASPEVSSLLEEAVVNRRNILLSGGAGTGKTTLLNALSRFIPAADRIITIEDAAELRLQQEHVVRLEARPPNVEGRGAVTIRDLVRNALRMRPDRIIVGEVRGAEALDMLQAMNTGHSGSLATIHANSAVDALSRLETMALMANVALPLKVIREQVASAVNVVVHLERRPDGSRRIAEVVGLRGVSGGRYLIDREPIPGREERVRSAACG